MSITATELKNNLGKYLMLSATEDILITKNGKVVAKLTNPAIFNFTLLPMQNYTLPQRKYKY